MSGRSVARPRVASLVFFVLVGVLGVGLLTTGRPAGIVVGLFLLAVAAVCLGGTFRTRVRVDGDVLHLRTLHGVADPLRLDRLTRAHLTSFATTKGPELELTDADGTHVVIDATNLRLAPLYAILAEHIEHAEPEAWDGSVANPRLLDRMDRHRPGLAPRSG